MKISQYIIKLLRRRKPASTGAANGGPAIEFITIEKDGHTHTQVIGWTTYSKGHVPKNGHKPITVIDQS